MPGHAAEIDPPRVHIDPQDPLPESNWIPRRRFVFVARIAWTLMIAVAAWSIYRLGGAEPRDAISALLMVVYCLVGMLVIDAILYLVAPSAEQVTKMAHTITAWKSGISFRTRTTASSESGTIVSDTVAGKDPAPKIGPAPPPPSRREPPPPPPVIIERAPDVSSDESRDFPDPAPAESVELRPRELGPE